MHRDYDNTDLTRSRLKRAYLELCLEFGERNVYVSLVASRAEVSRRTFYRYYHDIPSLRSSIFDDALPRSICTRVYREKETIPLEEASNAILHFYERHPLAIQFFLGKNIDFEFELETVHLLKVLFKGLIERSFEIDEEKEAYLVESLTYARLSLIRLWAQKECSPSLWKMNALVDNVMERTFWTQIAHAANGQTPKLSIIEKDISAYPWQIDAR